MGSNACFLQEQGACQRRSTPRRRNPHASGALGATERGCEQPRHGLGPRAISFRILRLKASDREAGSSSDWTTSLETLASGLGDPATRLGQLPALLPRPTSHVARRANRPKTIPDTTPMQGPTIDIIARGDTGMAADSVISAAVVTRRGPAGPMPSEALPRAQGALGPHAHAVQWAHG